MKTHLYKYARGDMNTNDLYNVFIYSNLFMESQKYFYNSVEI